MDETPMWFELATTGTLELTRSRTVPVLTCSVDEQSFMVAMAAKANCEKLPLKVIQRCSTAEYQHTTKDANFSAQESLNG